MPPPPWVPKPCQTGVKTEIEVHSASLIPFLRFVAGGFLNPRIATGLVAMRPTGGINLERRTPSRSFRINSDAPCSVRLTMFAHAHANSSKRGSFGFSGTRTATMQKPNPIPSLIRRQYEPEVQAAIWRSREVDLNGVHRHHKPAGVVFIRPP